MLFDRKETNCRQHDGTYTGESPSKCTKITEKIVAVNMLEFYRESIVSSDFMVLYEICLTNLLKPAELKAFAVKSPTYGVGWKKARRTVGPPFQIYCNRSDNVEIKKLEIPIAEFNGLSSKVNEQLTKLLIAVTEGRAPSKNEMDSVESAVGGLQKKYDEIYEITAAAVATDELPAKGLSVTEYVKTIENSKSNVIRVQLANAKAILERFISVKSLIDAYSKALAPFQTEATDLLTKLGAADAGAAEPLLPGVAAPELFLRVMDADINSDESVSLLENVSKYYPARVQIGLAGKNYFADKPPAGQKVGPVEDTAAVVAEDAAETDEVASTVEAVEAVDTEASADAMRNNEIAYIKEAALSDSVHESLSEAAEKQANSTSSVINEQETIVGKIISENDSETLTAEMLTASNKVKTSTPSASSFRKEIVNMSKTVLEIRMILPLMTNLGVLTKEQIYFFGVCAGMLDENDKDRENVEAAMEALVSKGLMAHFEYFDGEASVNAYCLSSYCYGCMQKDTIASQMNGFWFLSYGDYKICTGAQIEKSTIVNAISCNSILLEYYYGIKPQLSKENYATVEKSINWCDDHYQVMAFYEDTPFNCYIINAATDVLRTNAENLLLVYGRLDCPTGFNATCENVFVFKGGEVYRCDTNSSILEQLERFETDSADNESVQKANAAIGEGAAFVHDGADVFEETVSESSEQEGLEETEHASAQGSQNAPMAKQVGKEDSHTEKLTPLMLLNLERTPTDTEFYDTIMTILGNDVSTKEELSSAIVQSVLLANGAAFVKGCVKCRKLSVQLQLATNVLFGDTVYSSECLASAFKNPGEDDQSLLLSAYLFAMLVPATPYDYVLKSQTKVYFDNYDSTFSELPPFKALYNKLMDVQDVIPNGFSPSVVARLGSAAESESFINEIRLHARDNLTLTQPKTRMKALPLMYAACFGIGSDLYDCMAIISENKQDDLDIVETVLSEYCDSQNGTYTLNEAKIEAKLSAAWDDANSKKQFKLEYDAHDLALKQFMNRLTVMESWVEHISSLHNKKLDLSRPKTLKEEIQTLIQGLQKNTNWRKVKNANVLSWALRRMYSYLNGQNSSLEVFAELLSTGTISLADNGTPNIDATLESVKYYEPWRNALRHIAAKKKSFFAVKAEILNEDLGDETGLVDNLHQLSMIGRLLEDTSDEYRVSDGQMKEAIKSAEYRTIRFKETLELAYTYNQITETEKENLAGIMSQYKNGFFELQDFACWRRFLEALERQITECAAHKKASLRTTLDARSAKGANSPLLRAADRLLEEDMNLAVTEEYINRYDAGETGLDEGLDTILHDKDYFSDFLSESVFDPLLNECRRYSGRALKAFGVTYLEKNAPEGWTNRHKEDSRTLINNWPSKRDATLPEQIKILFTCFGFDVNQAVKIPSRKEELYQLSVRPTPRSMADYRHPISAFGTKIKAPINVVVLYGNYMGKELVDTVSSLNLKEMSIVLIDRPVDIAQRRLIGEIFHTQTTGQNPFILIDQVLALYLAMHQVTERMSVLLQCSLPFTTYQPFVRDGGSTADEMFCGRTRELTTIIDPNGACVVYGGRQLGKTALLERAESRCSKPENKAYAVYTNIIHCKSEEELIDKIIMDINKKTGENLVLNPCKTLKEFCNQIYKLYSNKTVASMLLLMDEADNFLASIANDGYTQLQPLVDLKRETKNAFKFVLAGLHNVCRAENATKNNGIFGQLGTPLCIKPLSPTDALQLLSRPLRYLGFQIDRYPHLETILTDTNYYPGILQFFGYRLVETLTGQYSNYYHAADGNPPFTLQEKQLGAVMNSTDLNRSIRDKFRWSLELDPRYFMIARCITMLYYFYEEDRVKSSWLGYTVGDIMKMAGEYDIHCLKNESRGGYINLLDEMVDMGILSQPQTGFYRLRRSSFVDIIGKDIDTLEAEIISSNEEE